jgi:hypothetical protein
MRHCTKNTNSTAIQIDLHQTRLLNEKIGSIGGKPRQKNNAAYPNLSWAVPISQLPFFHPLRIAADCGGASPIERSVRFSRMRLLS